MDNRLSVWRLVVTTALAEGVMIALAFAWVAVYSMLLNTGHDAAFYEEYAKVASPLVSLAAGPVVFGALGALAGSRAQWLNRRELAWAIGLYLALDIVIVLTLAEDLTYNLLMWVPNALTKAGAAYLAYRWRRAAA